MRNCWPSFLCTHIQGCTFTVASSNNILYYFDVCALQLAQFIIQTNKSATYIYIYIYIYIYVVSIATCFNAPISSSGSLILLLG